MNNTKEHFFPLAVFSAKHPGRWGAGYLSSPGANGVQKAYPVITGWDKLPGRHWAFSRKYGLGRAVWPFIGEMSVLVDLVAG